MHNFLKFIKEFRIPKKDELRVAIASYDKKKFLILVTIIIVAFIAVLSILDKINSQFVVTVPEDGGSITEGIIGVPTLINPVLAISDADKDISALIYSGLMRKDSNGELIPDLAESYTVSPDGMTYTFTLKNNLKFHDGEPLNADDVVFTIEKIKDPLIKSPRKVGWDGVEIEKKSSNTVVFTLKQPYISFLDNTTIGILPMHVWKNVTEAEFSLSPLNIKAVGEGPYMINSVVKDKDSIPERYNLRRFKDYKLGTPHIKNITFISFANEKDLMKDLVSHSIDQASGLSPENSENIIKAGYIIKTAILPRIFGIFWNSEHNKIFTDKAVVNAFDKAIDRQEIVDEVLNGYGAPIHSPIPETILPNESDPSFSKSRIEESKDILEKAGWTIGPDGIRVKGGTKVVTQTKKVGKKTITQNVTVSTGQTTKLVLSITTGNTPELKKAAMLIKEQLESIGASVDIKSYETGPLNQLIRSRDYEALFFGQIINHESDLFSFWHSSQKNDPGLNIALYSNKNVDSILENVQKINDVETRYKKYSDLSLEFNKDLPAILIYSPKYLYAISSKIHNLSFEAITVPSDRFVSAYKWYTNEDKVWKIFTK